MLFIFGYIVGMTVTLLLLYMGHNLYELRKQPTETINKQSILKSMSQRVNAFRDRIDRDCGGNLVGCNEAYREVKYWKESIERGVFDEDGIDG